MCDFYLIKASEPYKEQLIISFCWHESLSINVKERNFCVANYAHSYQNVAITNEL